MPFYEYGEERFFRADAAPDAVAAAAARRFLAPRGAFQGSASRASAQLTAEVFDGISDLQFTARYRVPFQFSRFVREHFKAGNLPAKPLRA